MTAELLGGHILIQSLVNLGARHAFGIPGESYLAALDGLHDTTGTFDYVMCRNEGGAAFMAAAYGKLTGMPGICLVTRGPGATNAAIGVHTAMQDSVPMLLFVGQVGTDIRGREAFQEVDYRAMFGSIAKWVVEIDRTERLPELVARAWQRATTGRPGPVVVALPEDMLSAKSAARPVAGPTPFFPATPAARAIREVERRLTGATRPVILVGGCTWSEDGRAAFEAFAEASRIPVLAAFRYHDRFNNLSPVYCGEAGVGMPPHVSGLLRDADLIVAVEVRFGEMTTDGYTLLDVPRPRQGLVHVHSSDLELGKIYQPDLAIHSDPNAFAGAISKVEGDWADWCTTARAAFEAGFDLPAQPSPVDMGVVAAHLRAHLPEDVIVTNGAGNFTVWPNKFLTYGPKARLLAPQSGAMGYGLPAAIAAKVAYPDRLVVCFAGDGDFQMNCQELASAAQAGACPVVLIVNNGTYGTIRAHQERHYPGRVSGTDMRGNPDFAALARAYGCHGERVARTEDFPAAFARAVASGTGAVLDLAVSAEALTPRQTLSEIRAAGEARQAAG